MVRTSLRRAASVSVFAPQASNLPTPDARTVTRRGGAPQFEIRNTTAEPKVSVENVSRHVAALTACAVTVARRRRRRELLTRDADALNGFSGVGRTLGS